MTNKQMLTEWVQSGIDGGWKATELTHHSINLITESLIIDIRGAEVHNGIGKTSYKTFSLPDLINDDEFMKAVYGAELICDNKPCPLKFSRCNNCHSSFYGNPMKRSQHIQQQAIILNGDEQIQYLYDKMKEASNESSD